MFSEFAIAAERTTQLDALHLKIEELQLHCRLSGGDKRDVGAFAQPASSDSRLTLEEACKAWYVVSSDLPVIVG